MRNNKGFSLFEVLIALLLTVIGILGMVALQGQGLKGTTESANRNQAVAAAVDLMEIMRSYRHEMYTITKPTYHTLKGSTDVYDSSGNFKGLKNKCPSGTTLATTLEMRIGCWKAGLEDRLPDGTTVKVCPSSSLTTDGKVKCDSGSDGDALAIQIEWTSNDDICQDDKCHYVLRSEL